MAEYKLTRLEDVGGKINWKWERVSPQYVHLLIDWDYACLEEEASKLQVGESKIYQENVP